MSKKYYERISRGSGTSARPFHSKFGASILKKFGWEEGQGLGREGTGTSDCVQIKRREEGLGLGANNKAPEEEQWKNWWEGMYNNLAQKIQPKNGSSEESSDDEREERKRKKKTKDRTPPDKSSSDDSSDEDGGSSSVVLKACGGHTSRRAGMQLGKLKRLAAAEAEAARVAKAAVGVETAKSFASKRKECDQEAAAEAFVAKKRRRADDEKEETPATVEAPFKKNKKKKRRTCAEEGKVSNDKLREIEEEATESTVADEEEGEARRKKISKNRRNKKKGKENEKGET